MVLDRFRQRQKGFLLLSGGLAYTMGRTVICLKINRYEMSIDKKTYEALRRSTVKIQRRYLTKDEKPNSINGNGTGFIWQACRTLADSQEAPIFCAGDTLIT